MEIKILIADEDQSVRRMVARVLEIAGYVAIQVADWHEAAVRCKAVQPSLILLDLEMLPPGGWTVLREIRRDSGTVPVIGMTAWPNQYDLAVRWGIDAVMEKPLDLGFLLQTIQELLAPKPERAAKRPAQQSLPLLRHSMLGQGNS
jgi:DNA-binding response OmpR family regulator